MEFTLKQAQDLVALFGGEESEITVVEVGSDEPSHSGPGLYAYCSEYPDEGATLLDLTSRCSGAHKDCVR